MSSSVATPEKGEVKVDKGTASPSTPGNDEFENEPTSKFVLSTVRTKGHFDFRTMGKEKEYRGKSITKGIKKLKENPQKWIAITYQDSMKTWPANQQEYNLIPRAGTEGLTPCDVCEDGWMKVLLMTYLHLPPFPNNDLPIEFRDQWTDEMTHKGRKLHETMKPLMPGRGQGIGDTPLLKTIGDIDPSDIHQGQVGDCWLLSAISAMAEFDGAIKRLYRKTPRLDERPLPEANMYTITLWDLTTWTEVDYVIDERLAVNPTRPDNALLSCKLSEDGELWACYLEKALAIHCGGWDAITGGQCTHAWAIMTGCKEQYIIMPNKRTGLYTCQARFNPNTKQWLDHENDIHKCDNVTGVWEVDWPEVGGGGFGGLHEDELFMKMFAWDQTNYIVAAGTKAGTGDEGLVDNHAYTVIEAAHDVAGTGINMFKVRNPWGKGEMEDGEFDDDGPGWEMYPQIKAQLNPVVADDGIFWVTHKEFFNFFGTIYLSASDMTAYLED